MTPVLIKKLDISTNFPIDVLFGSMYTPYIGGSLILVLR